MNYSEEEIKVILNNYHKKKEYEKQRYLIIKDTDEFINKNRARAKAHYDLNKESMKQKYQDNKDIMNAKSSYYYYKKNNKLDKFNEKNKEKYELLKSINFIE
tara:strand:+ start:3284 stop:3589 length:306 start_codon:yes stop_codon:yes gene_type:complete